MKHVTLSHYADAFCHTIGRDWKLVSEIGSGNSATVFELTRPSARAALKVYHPRFFEGRNAEVERRRVRQQMALRGHGHPYLIDFLDAGEIEDTCFLLMEYFPWKALSYQLQELDRSLIPEIIEKIASAAEFLEEQGLVHRDIKPANILVSPTCIEVKLLDLGVIRSIHALDRDRGTDDGDALPFVATAQYSSPAYLFRKGSPTPDMWKALTFYQLGAVLHDMLAKAPLFDTEVRSKNKFLVGEAVRTKIPDLHVDDVPPRLVALARNCLVKEDGIRMTRIGWDSFRTEASPSLDEFAEARPAETSLGKQGNASAESH